MAYITRTTGSPMTNQKKFTYSAWLKITDLGTYQRPIQNYYDGNNRGYILFCSSSDSAANTFFLYDKEGGTINYQANTTAKFRDTNGWYHVVWRVDSTQATQSDRVRFYVNGELQSMSITTNCSQNVNMGFNSAGANLRIGGQESGSEPWKGVMSHVHFCDGYSYGPDSFGSTDSTTGEWKINTSPSVTYGNNGFFVFKDDAAVTDRSGEGNNFTMSGSITPTVDNPSNVFCTMNPLDNQIAGSTFSQGNNTIQTNTSNYTWNTGTLGMTSGKFYWEVKYSANSNTDYYNLIGIADRPTDHVHDVLGRQTDCSNYAYYSDNGQSYEKNTLNSYGAAYTVGDIIGVAVDLDNNKLYFSKNGTWQNSGDPTSGSTGTGAISIDAISSTTTGVYFPASGDYGSSQNATNQHNFGNGYFGTTAVASAGTNASGIGIFEYDVPTGYTALCTKGLNE